MDKNPETLVEPDWLEAHLDDPKVRVMEINWDPSVAYDAGHIPGARGGHWKDVLWDPFMREFPTPEDFAKRCGAEGIDNDTTVVFYGDPVQFGTYGWWVFKYCGHADVRVLNGGRTRWIKEGRPMTTEIGDISCRDYELRPRLEGIRAGRDDVLAALGAAGTVILDHRSPEEFNGEMLMPPGFPDHGAERMGRIPGAFHLHFSDMLEEDETFKSEPELRALLEQRGATSEVSIISYCRLSHRATLAHFVMTELLGYRRVRNYDGSWTEWGSIVGVPIER